MTRIEIVQFDPSHTEAVIDLTLRAWAPVFVQTRSDVPRFVYDAFYPDGWQRRQAADVRALLAAEPENIWLARCDGTLAGYVGIRLHPEDQMGEIYIIAVAPDCQRQGIGRKLMAFAEYRIRDAGMKMMMVETIADSGHEPARRAYEAFGFQRWPVARYFKPI